MIIIDNEYNLIVVEDLKVLKTLKLNGEQINALESWLRAPEVTKKAVRCWLEYHTQDMAVQCVLQLDPESDPVRLVARLEPGSSATHHLASALQGHWHKPIEVTSIREDHIDGDRYDLPTVVYTITFQLPNGTTLQQEFVRDSRFIQR